MFYPVKKSFEPVKEQEPDALRELLSNERGLKFFELYLATELSLENLFFYRSVRRWKKKYQEGSGESVDGAMLIVDLYLKSGADLEVNISHTLKTVALREIREGRIKQTVFDDCLEDVVKLMVTI